MRLRRLEDELRGELEIDWRSFLLRPRPMGNRDLERFRAYTQSWMRPAGDADAASFRVWQTDAGPPSHSIPPHLVAKAAATIGKGAFHAMHERLMHAYFAENRDITDDDTLFALWGEADLPAEAFSRREDPACLRAVVAEHNEAIECGVNGVPAARIEGNDVPFVGAHPIEVYRQWVQRTLDEKRSRT